MKHRFLLFFGLEYYPEGGWKDCRGGFDSVADAVQFATNHDPDWWHVVDLKDNVILIEGRADWIQQSRTTKPKTIIEG